MSLTKTYFIYRMGYLSHHVELVVFADQSRHGKWRYATRGQRIVGINDSPVLGISFCQTGIETRPKQPQEYRPCKSFHGIRLLLFHVE